MPLWELSCWWRILWLQSPVHSLWLASGPLWLRYFSMQFRARVIWIPACVSVLMPLHLLAFPSLPLSPLPASPRPTFLVSTYPFSLSLTSLAFWCVYSLLPLAHVTAASIFVLNFCFLTITAQEVAPVLRKFWVRNKGDAPPLNPLASPD